MNNAKIVVNQNLSDVSNLDQLNNAIGAIRDILMGSTVTLTVVFVHSYFSDGIRYRIVYVSINEGGHYFITNVYMSTNVAVDEQDTPISDYIFQVGYVIPNDIMFDNVVNMDDFEYDSVQSFENSELLVQPVKNLLIGN